LASVEVRPQFAEMKGSHSTIAQVLVCVTFVAASCTSLTQEHNRKFGSTEIRKVELGMTLEEVEIIMDRPLQVSSFSGVHNSMCAGTGYEYVSDVSPDTDIRKIVLEMFSLKDRCCETSKADRTNKNLTLVYTEHGTGYQDYPMVWIHLDSAFLVKSVFIKEYEGFLGIHEPCIYWIDKEHRFEHKEKFEKHFD